MKRVLFVDDDSMVLETLECTFHGARHEWELQFATSGAQALKMMEDAPADVVVSDMRMPKMNGAELLNQLTERFPKTIRFILSGYADMEQVMQCIAGTHQFLCKPGDILTLQATIRRAVEMDRWVHNDQVKSLVLKLSTIPSLPTLYFQIMKELRSPEADLENVGATIARDPAMTAKMLQLVNSAFFGLAHKLSDPTEAVMQLGMDTIKSLVLAIHVFSELESIKGAQSRMEKVYHHCLGTATTAKRIAQMERQSKSVIDESFTAGLLHDIGRLVLLANLPEQYAEALALSERDILPLEESERIVFGASHAETGGYLLGLWGLPIAIVESAVFHHRPQLCQTTGFTSLTAVHVANVLEQELGANVPEHLRPKLDAEYLHKAGVADNVNRWRNALAATSSV